MKKIVFAVTLIGVLGLFHVQWGAGLWLGAAAAGGPMNAFVDHPERCAQLLGDNASGDVLPPAFHADLEAALDASDQPAERAIVSLSVRCKQRQGRAG